MDQMFSFFRKGKKRKLSFSPPPPQSSRNVRADSKPTAIQAAAPIPEPVIERAPSAVSDDVVNSKQVDLTGIKARGHIDIFSESTIQGWVYYSGHTDIPVTLEFYFDAKLVGTIIADKVRADVKRAGFETDRCGFEFIPPPGAFAECKSIEVRAANGQTIARKLASLPA
jgi:hypothetical protein